jgi:hypothetical protein
VRTHDGKVNMLVRGGNDKATTQPLRVLLGLDQVEKKEGGTSPTDPGGED